MKYIGCLLAMVTLVGCQSAQVSQSSTKTYLYEVQKGDTVNKIAQRFGISSQTIVNLNQLKDPSRIYPKQRLHLPINARALDNASPTQTAVLTPSAIQLPQTSSTLPALRAQSDVLSYPSRFVTPTKSLIARKYDPKADILGVWFAPSSTQIPITAAAMGRVSYIGEDEDGKMSLVLKHGGNYTTGYHCLEDILVEVGETLSQGAPLGKPCVHEGTPLFEFRMTHKKRDVDPLRYLERQ